MSGGARQGSTIVLLVGPKGAGKSTIGNALAAHPGISFLRVEPIYLEAMRTQPDLPPADLEPIGFGAILRAVDDSARAGATVCMESTGTAQFFARFLQRLRASYRVLVVRVTAAPETCLQRVRDRDRTGHIPVSDERVREINRLAAAVQLDWDLELDNSAPESIGAHAAAIAALLRHCDGP